MPTTAHLTDVTPEAPVPDLACPNCGSRLQHDTGKTASAMLCAGCHVTLSPTGEVIDQVNLLRSPEHNRATRMIMPVGINGWAIAASYLALIGLISCGIFGPFSIILGIIALVSLKKNPGQRGKGRAWFSIVMGTMSTGLTSLVVVAMIISGEFPGFGKPQEVVRLNEESWDIVKNPNDNMGNYLTALQKATRASKLAPKNANILNTLGVAQYRAGHYRECVETLTRADRFRDGTLISDWIFITMAHHRLGNHDDARKGLATVRWVLTNDKIEEGSNDAGFIKELAMLLVAIKSLPSDNSN